MNSLDQALNEYIAIRRALGFALREVAGCLRNFVTFLKTEGATYITKELALRWATQPAHAQPYTWAWRLGMVRRFAAWHSATEPRTEVPAPGLLPHRYQRKTPHIYSDEEIASLLRGAGSLSLHRYRCEASFVDTDEEEGREPGPLFAVPSHCATRRSAGPYPNAKPTCKAERARVGSPSG